MRDSPFKFIKDCPTKLVSFSEEVFLPIYNVRFFVGQYNDSLFNEYDIPPPSNMNKISIKRKAEYLAGRIVASLALNSIGYPKVKLVSTPDGIPLWPDTVLGSISHSSFHAIACAIPKNNKILYGIGIDIEPIMSQETAIAVSTQIICINEANYLQKLTEISFPVALTLVFSAKESLYKALSSTSKLHLEFKCMQLVEIKRKQITLKLVFPELLVVNGEILSTFKVNYCIYDKEVLTSILI